MVTISTSSGELVETTHNLHFSPMPKNVASAKRATFATFFAISDQPSKDKAVGSGGTRIP